MRNFFCKISILAVITVLLLPVSANVFASGQGVNIENGYVEFSVPAGYDVITIENIDKASEIIEKNGVTQDELLRSFNDNYCVCMAYSQDLKTFFVVQIYETDESKESFDLRNLSTDELSRLIEAIEDDPNYSVYSHEPVNDDERALFLKFQRTTAEKPERYSLSYMTITNGLNYVFTLASKDTSFSDKNSEELDDLFKSIRFSERSDPRPADSINKILVLILYGALAVVSIVIIYIVYKRVSNWGNKSEILRTRRRK